MQRQMAVYEWVQLAFGPEHANSLSQRSVRFLEEAIELYQACNCRGEMDPGVALQMAHKLLDYIFAKPVGVLHKEIGAVGLTLLSVAAAAEYNAEAEERMEVERVMAIDPAKMAERNRAKNEAGFKVYRESRQ
jgi:putative ubiquitin-RnfH superfamily antitoxin RatB of RatAB toxin-antitoxin module